MLPQAVYDTECVPTSNDGATADVMDAVGCISVDVFPFPASNDEDSTAHQKK